MFRRTSPTESPLAFRYVMAIPELEAGYVIAERYRVEYKLGEGGMGHVYLVTHLSTEERFALKILDPQVANTESAQERFRREARAPARINSDHVCRVVDNDIAVELGGAPFLVMEYLEGDDLEVITYHRGALPPHEVVTYLRHVARGLDKAHAIGIIHRDLKPDNVVVTFRDDGTPCAKILDFGIAKINDGDQGFKATTTGDVFGTPMYMSPEQCLGETERVGPASDLWSLGLLTHRLLTGDDFWRATSLIHLIAQIAYEPMPKAAARGADFGPAYEAWFEKICSRDPSARFGTAHEAVTALQQALGVAADNTGVFTSYASGDFSSSLPAPSGLHKTNTAITLDPNKDRPRGPSRKTWVAVAAVALVTAFAFALVALRDESGSAAPAASPPPEEVVLPPVEASDALDAPPSAEPPPVLPATASTGSAAAPPTASAPPPRRPWVRRPPPPQTRPTPPRPPPPPPKKEAVSNPLDSRL